MMEDKVTPVSYKEQNILFYAHMSRANGAGKICKLLSNWPVKILKPCQTTVRETLSRRWRIHNYWVGFSCHSLYISLGNYRSQYRSAHESISYYFSRHFQNVNAALLVNPPFNV